MTHSAVTNQTIALAGILQAAYLVDQVARTGKAQEQHIEPLFSSLFAFDADTTADIYGGVSGLDLGLRVANDLVRSNKSVDYATTTKYAVGMLHLAGQLNKNPEMLSILRSRLEHSAFKADHFSNDINELSSSLAAIYQDTISTFKYRIQVSGSMQQLQNPNNADLIRALLLTGIRSCVLWRQLGGRRWHLFFKKSRILQAIQDLSGTDNLN